MPLGVAPIIISAAFARKVAILPMHATGCIFCRHTDRVRMDPDVRDLKLKLVHRNCGQLA
jgi:hypothetical protein